MHIVTGLSADLLPPSGEADGGKAGAGLVPGMSFFPCVWKWMVRTITVLWMEALKQLMAEEWHGRKEWGKRSAVCH